MPAFGLSLSLPLKHTRNSMRDDEGSEGSNVFSRDKKLQDTNRAGEGGGGGKSLLYV